MLNVRNIEPDKKDLDRARNISFRKNIENLGDTPLQGKADSMAKLITKEDKLIRRAMAIASYWGTSDHCGEVNGKEVCVNVWKPFAEKLESLGYGYSDITFISQYEHDDVFEQMGLDDLLF